VFDEIRELALKTCGERILFLTGLGATETAPYAFGRTWDTDAANNIGLPPPGLEVKLVPAFGKLEARLRGPTVTPGYWRSPALTAEAFDDEGFYRLGDALQFADADDPQQGLLYEGRVAEDFKLSSGTWVSVGTLRTKLIEALVPLARDAVLAGANRDDIAALIFPDLDACRELAALPASASASEVLAHAAVREEFRRRLHAQRKASTGSSTCVSRAVLLEAPASLDLGETTDKGSINQRAVLQHRAGLVEDLYANPLPPHVIAAGGE
jgi:feruloyl-CoA synthase